MIHIQHRLPHVHCLSACQGLSALHECYSPRSELPQLPRQRGKQVFRPKQFPKMYDFRLLVCVPYWDTDQNQNFVRSITLFIKSPLYYNLEPVRRCGWFWPGSAGDGGEESQPNVLCGSARETVRAPQAWPEEALHCRGKPLLDGPWDAIWSVSLAPLITLTFWIWKKLQWRRCSKPPVLAFRKNLRWTCGYLLLWNHHVRGKAAQTKASKLMVNLRINEIPSLCVFSLKIIGRVSADPDFMPRAKDFGLNVASFLQEFHPPLCPSAFLPLAVLCCEMDIEKRYHCTNTALKFWALAFCVNPPCLLDSFRPSFSKLAEWLDNLLMHMDIGLHLLSELDQLCKTFWQNRSNQNLIHSKDGPRPQVEKENNSQNGVQGHFEKLNSRQDTTTTERSHPREECTGLSLDQCQNSCSSAGIESVTETHENNSTSGQPQTQKEVSEPVAGQSNRPRRICSVLWDKSTEESSWTTQSSLNAHKSIWASFFQFEINCEKLRKQSWQ